MELATSWDLVSDGLDTRLEPGRATNTTGEVMQLSYAQNLEDYHLDLVFGDQQTGTYVDVGGGHPVADNVSFWFYLKGWRGLIVEPQEALAAIYAHVRPRDHTVSCLAGRSEGEAEFHVVDKLHGFSTTVRENAAGANQFGADFTTVRKPVRTLAALCAEAGLTRIDFLKIDVEGAEAETIAGMDFKRWRPRVVLVEAIAPGSMKESWQDWEPALLAAGYSFAFFDRLNRFYVAQEEAALADALSARAGALGPRAASVGFRPRARKARSSRSRARQGAAVGFLRHPAVARARHARAAGGQRAGGDEGGGIRPSRRKVADRHGGTAAARLRRAAISRSCSTPTRCAPRSAASPAPMTAGTSWSERCGSGAAACLLSQATFGCCRSLPRRAITAILPPQSRRPGLRARMLGSGRRKHSCEVVVLWLIAGAIVGWLANQIMVKDSYGTQTDLIIGAVGGLVGGVLFPQLGFLLGGGYLGHIVNPVVGAVIAIFASRFVKK